MLRHCRRKLARTFAFAACAGVYWLEVFPRARREIRRWRARAQQLTAPALRELALGTANAERGNLEGAAAFAVLAPRGRRAAVVCAAIAFQAAYDFADTLAEQPSTSPDECRRLHLVLLEALDERRDESGAAAGSPDAARGDTVATSGADAHAYLSAMARACRSELRSLPSYPLVRGACLRAAARMVAYQSLTHAPSAERRRMERWAAGLPGAAEGLRWWEAAGAAASSLGVFALLAAAARPALRPEQARAIERAYVPRIGALHVLLDSLADRESDERTSHHSLVSHYGGHDRAAAALSRMTRSARAELEGLPRAVRHEALLAAMVAFYLASPLPDGLAGAHARRTRRELLDAAGPMAAPAAAILRARAACSARRAPPLPAGEQRGGAFEASLWRLLESQVVDFPLAARQLAR